MFFWFWQFFSNEIYFQFMKDKIDQNTNFAKLPTEKKFFFGIAVNFIIKTLKSKHLVGLSFLRWQIFFWGNKIKYFTPRFAGTVHIHFSKLLCLEYNTWTGFILIWQVPNSHVKNWLGMNAFPKILSPHYKEQLPKSCGSRKSSIREGSMKKASKNPPTHCTWFRRDDYLGKKWKLDLHF